MEPHENCSSDFNIGTAGDGKRDSSVGQRRTPDDFRVLQRSGETIRYSTPRDRRQKTRPGEPEKEGS